jgi:hypothetical protein
VRSAAKNIPTTIATMKLPIVRAIVTSAAADNTSAKCGT